ncbi:MAG: glutamate ligase domain-containing protein, partial [Alphaproteobacteria bacterium]
QPDISIIGIDDEFCRDYYEKNKHDLKLIPISGVVLPDGGVGVLDGKLIDTRRVAGMKEKTILSLPFHKNLRGPHHAQNMAAAYLIADYYGVSVTDFLSALKTFTPLPHRQEWVAHIAGVDYINDSKATNVDAALKSLCGFQNIRWLAGGALKMGDRFFELAAAASHIKHGYFFGAGARKLQNEVMAYIASDMFDDLAGALSAARRDAQYGDVVLLSPLGASFDQYKNFEERGDDFKHRVLAFQNKT